MVKWKKLRGMDVSEHSQEQGLESTGQTRRYIRRVDGPGWAFYPFGLIPALGLFLITLFALFPFASFWVEQVAKESSQSALRQGGEDWANVSASGQWVTLQGDAPSSARAVNAVSLVRNAAAPTFFGAAKPVTRIIDQTQIIAAGAAETDTAAPDTNVVTEEPPVPAATDTASNVATCDESLRSLLRQSQLKFASNSSRIQSQSGPLLDQLALTLRSCDLDVTVEGHTDATGSATRNIELSLARAQAIRDALVIRGVPAERIDAEGFGANRPIASNATREGREQNRRIEFNLGSPSGEDDE